MISKLGHHTLLCRFRRLVEHSGRAALILPPARPGSLGDQAMFRATLTTLRQAGFDHIGVLTYDQTDRYTTDPTIQHHQLRDYLCYGLEEGMMRFIHIAQAYTHFFLIGADVMDGYYSAKETRAKIEIAEIAVRCGLNTSLLGFSFNDHADEDCVEALRELPTSVAMYARDPVSYRRLSHLLGRHITPSADLAFLLIPNASRLEVEAFLDKMNGLKAAGRILFGINVTNMILGKTSTLAQVVTLLGYVRQMMLAAAEQYPNITFILFSHDNRGPMSDVILSKRLADSLHGVLTNTQLLLVPEALDSDEIKALCAPLDGAFTCRMHFGIACLSQGVPIAAIGYQGKFEGLMERFDLVNMLLPDVNSLNPDSLTTLMKQLIKERTHLKAHVLERLPDIRRLAANNFSNSLPHQILAELTKQDKDSSYFPGSSTNGAG